MTKGAIKNIVTLVNSGWRPYSAEPDYTAYERLQCPHAEAKKGNKPVWFVRGDIFLCVGCSRACTLSRPEGFIMPLPIKYEERGQEPYTSTPAEMVSRKSLLRVDEAAYCLNISERTVYDWIAEGKLRKVKEQPVRIPAEDVAYRMTNFDD
jgi:excisionase family DNA binding protein